METTALEKPFKSLLGLREPLTKLFIGGEWTKYPPLPLIRGDELGFGRTWKAAVISGPIGCMWGIPCTAVACIQRSGDAHDIDLN